jgi:hypothetical protein
MLWFRGGLFVVALLVLLPIAVLVHLYGRTPSIYRIPFPADKELTEQAAVQLTRQALKLDGKATGTMRPVTSGHKDLNGRDIYFLTRADDADRGWVFWWLEKPEYTWEYSVGIVREGDEVVCSINKPL